MRYSGHEYREAIFQLNFNRNKKIFMLSSLICAVIVFVSITIIYKDLFLGFALSIFGAWLGYYISKKTVIDSAKKVNFVQNIKYVDQEIFEDKIIEKVYRDNGLENSGEYFYKDIVLVKEDKKNFYLYLNDYAAIIVAKNKLKNIENFKEILTISNIIK